MSAMWTKYCYVLRRILLSRLLMRTPVGALRYLRTTVRKDVRSDRVGLTLTRQIGAHVTPVNEIPQPDRVMTRWGYGVQPDRLQLSSPPPAEV